MQENETPDVAKEMKSNLGSAANVVFSFDTTGSMNPCIQQVRQKLRDLVEMMSADIPGLKIGLIAHGDYCDGDNCIKTLDLTDDLEKIMTFINTTPNTGGGDAPECYEFALQSAKNLSWPKEGGSVVLIGDDEPHPIGYVTSAHGEQQTTNNINWRDEVRQLLEKNVKVFPMQCLFRAGRDNVNKFWEEVSGISGTPLLMLESFGDSANTLEAVAYASAGAGAYEGYKMKFCAEVGTGERSVASSNLCSNQAKLEEFAKNVNKTE
jgi:hypothetical protein